MRRAADGSGGRYLVQDNDPVPVGSAHQHQVGDGPEDQFLDLRAMLLLPDGRQRGLRQAARRLVPDRQLGELVADDEPQRHPPLLLVGQLVPVLVAAPAEELGARPALVDVGHARLQYAERLEQAVAAPAVLVDPGARPIIVGGLGEMVADEQLHLSGGQLVGDDVVAEHAFASARKASQIDAGGGLPVEDRGLRRFAGSGEPDAETGAVPVRAQMVERESHEFGERPGQAGMDVDGPVLRIGLEPPSEASDLLAGGIHLRIVFVRLVDDSVVEDGMPSAVLDGRHAQIPVVQAHGGGQLPACGGLRVRQTFEQRLALVRVEHGEPVSGVFRLVHGLHLGALAGLRMFGAQVDFEAGVVAHVDAGRLPVDKDGDMPVPVDELEAGGLGLRMPGLPFRYLPVE